MPRTTRGPLLRAGMILAVALTALAVAVQLGATRALDLAILRAMPAVASVPLDVVTRLFTFLGGSQIELVFALALVVVWRREPRYVWVPLLVVAVIGLEYALKMWIVDPAPPRELKQHVTRVLTFLPTLPGIQLGHLHEFPSGHTARAAFFGVILGARYPRLRPLLAALVIGMTLTRIYNGSHFASAAVGGVLLGATVGCFGLAAAEALRPLAARVLRLRSAPR